MAGEFRPRLTVQAAGDASRRRLVPAALGVFGRAVDHGQGASNMTAVAGYMPLRHPLERAGPGRR